MEREYFGYIGGLLASFIFIPQILKMITTKRSKDLSYTTLLISNLSSAFVLVYSIDNEITPMIVTTIISLSTRLLIIFLKLYFDSISTVHAQNESEHRKNEKHNQTV